MRFFIVHAHHEPKSFNGAMTREATSALRDAGHEVVVSDLYAMGFNPVSDRRNFTTVLDPDYLKQQNEEAHAAKVDGFAAELDAEMEKLFWCDVLILQFPMWWFGLPAILKGWVDRVFAAGGKLYGGGKWYDNGVLAGRRAMCSITVGGPETMYGADGLNGAMEGILFPINHGILRFVGFTVVQPFLVHAPARLDDQARASRLADYRARVVGISQAPVIVYPPLADYDETYRLKRRPVAE
ncbi:MAG: NAD(P)H-dependent oxidoreductase [Caulobacterales bacterium]